MLSADPRKWAPVLALIVPIGLVKGLSVVLGAPGPEMATATPADQPSNSILQQSAVASGALDEEQKRIARHILEMRGKAFGDSPMYYDTLTVVTNDDRVPVIAIPQPLNVVVRGIMRAPRGSIALIDGYLYREGQSLQGHEGWVIVEIDGEAGTVLIENAAKDEIELLAVRPDDEQDPAVPPRP